MNRGGCSRWIFGDNFASADRSVNSYSIHGNSRSSISDAWFFDVIPIKPRRSCSPCKRTVRLGTPSTRCKSADCTRCKPMVPRRWEHCRMSRGERR
jgi:hypothetical protein